MVVVWQGVIVSSIGTGTGTSAGVSIGTGTGDGVSVGVSIGADTGDGVSAGVSIGTRGTERNVPQQVKWR